MAGPGGGSLPPKRKEIYKYEAPCTVFSMNWSVRPDKRFRYHMDPVKKIFSLCQIPIDKSKKRKYRPG
jgi:hypothetical protein